MSTTFDYASKLWRPAVVALAFATQACGSDLRTPEGGNRELAVPSRDDFPLVGDAMQKSCGTLDCHGQIGRNLRLFGRLGLRLPSDGGVLDPTTEEEYGGSYLSVIGLEPETLSKVVNKEASPFDLTMVRKARGLEKHKGNQLMSRGDALDVCIVGWLIREYSEEACTAAIEKPRPEPDGGQ